MTVPDTDKSRPGCACRCSERTSAWNVVPCATALMAPFTVMEKGGGVGDLVEFADDEAPALHATRSAAVPRANAARTRAR